MMRSLIDSDAIVTRRRRSRFRVFPSPLALLSATLVVAVTLALCARTCASYSNFDDRDTYPLEANAGPGVPRAEQLGKIERNDEDDDADADDDVDNLIPRYQLAESPNQQAQQARDADQQGFDYGELALARLLSRVKAASRTNLGEVYLLEDKDYPKSVFEDYAQHLGQVSGIATLPSDEVVIFHRADRHWNESTFNETSKQVPRDQQEKLIGTNTIMVIDRDGGSLRSFGSNLFHMPHSVASDNQGNLWVSDVARHQVMRLPAMNIRRMSNAKNSSAQIWPDIILGEAFVPGQDDGHFCQPSEIAVSSNGQLVYVADGYCNQRVMVFSGSSGKLIGSFGQNEDIRVAHSLALIEERNLLCVADRENHRILCYNAGLDGDLSHLGELMHQIEYPIGRVFAITCISPNHLLVSSNQASTNRYDLAILNPFTHELKLVWISSDLLEPHSLATTVDRRYAYAADLSKDAYKKVFKFHVIQRKN